MEIATYITTSIFNEGNNSIFLIMHTIGLTIGSNAQNVRKRIKVVYFLPKNERRVQGRQNSMQTKIVFQ